MPRSPRAFADLDEESIIARIARSFGQGAMVQGTSRGRVRLGLGDDTALIAPRAGRDLVVTCDAVVEGIDFLRERFPPAAIGHRALAQNLSDLAAMGAVPLAFTMTLVARPQTPLKLLDELARGMAALARRTGCPLIGGDLSSTQGPLTLSITALGEVERGAALTRRGAKLGDDIWVSGTLGGSALGLSLLLSSDPKTNGASGRQRACVRRALYPDARLALGRALKGHASACIDISDGLALDAGRLASASHARVVLDAEALPLARGATLDQAVASGEEYELLFAAPPRKATAVRQAGRRGGVAVTRIGQVARGRGLELVGAKALDAAGFDHFAGRARGA